MLQNIREQRRAPLDADINTTNAFVNQETERWYRTHPASRGARS